MAKGCVYKPVVVETRNGKKRRRRSRLYWTKYVDKEGKEIRRPLKLPNPNIA